MALALPKSLAESRNGFHPRAQSRAPGPVAPFSCGVFSATRLYARSALGCAPVYYLLPDRIVQAPVHDLRSFCPGGVFCARFHAAMRPPDEHTPCVFFFYKSAWRVLFCKLRGHAAPQGRGAGRRIETSQAAKHVMYVAVRAPARP